METLEVVFLFLYNFPLLSGAKALPHIPKLAGIPQMLQRCVCATKGKPAQATVKSS